MHVQVGVYAVALPSTTCWPADVIFIVYMCVTTGAYQPCGTDEVQGRGRGAKRDAVQHSSPSCPPVSNRSSLCQSRSGNVLSSKIQTCA